MRTPRDGLDCSMVGEFVRVRLRDDSLALLT